MLKDHVRQSMTGPDPQRLPCQWVAAPSPPGSGIERLCATIDTLGSREAINDWMDDALAKGIDPL
jgi:hypothetical protein